MKKFLIATHGKLAEGFASAVNVLLGIKTVEYINAYVDGDDTDYSEQISSFIDDLSDTDNGIIFTDLFGGSVNQKVISLVSNRNKSIYIITQVNLPIILEMILNTEQVSDELIEKLIDESPVQQVRVMHLADNTSTQNEKNFFE